MLAVLAIALLYFAWDRVEESVRTTLERRISERTGGILEIGCLEIDPLSLVVEAADIRLEVPADDAPPLKATLEAVSAELTFPGLFGLPGGRVRLSSLDLRGLSIEIDRRYFEARAGRRRKTDLPVDLRIDSLELSDGRYRYGDVTIPLDLGARDLVMVGSWDGASGTLSGTGGFETDIDGPWFRSPYPVRVHTGFRFRGSRLEAFGVEAESPGCKLVDGLYTLSWGSGSFMTGSASVTAELDELGKTLSERYPPIEGRLRGKIRLSRGSGQVQIRGLVEGERFRMGRLAASSARAEMLYDPGRLLLSGLEARAYGGKVRGTVEALLSRDSTWVDVQVRGDALGAHELFDFVGRPLPVDGSADVEVRFSGDPNDASTWDGMGEVTILRGTGTSDRISTDAHGSFDIRKGRLDVDAPWVVAASAEMEMGMSLDIPSGAGSFRLEGLSTDASQTKQATLRILEELEVPPSEWLARELQGAGTFRNLTILGEDELVEVSLDMEDGSWSGESFRRLGLDMEIAGDTLSMNRIEAAGDRWVLDGSMQVDLPTERIDAFDMEAKAIPAQTLLRYLAVELDLEGSVSGGIELGRGDQGLQGSGRIELEGGSLWGEPLEKGGAILEVRGDIARLPGAFLQGPAVDVSADLVIDLGRSAGEVRIGRFGLEMSDLAIARDHGIEIDGVLSGAGSIGWEADDGLNGAINLSCDRWTLFGQEMEPAAGRIGFGKAGADYHMGSRTGSIWSLGGHVDWDDDLTTGGTLALDGFRFDLVSDENLPPAWIRLTGELEIAGMLSRIEEATVQGSIEEAELRVGGELLRTRKPVPVRLEAEGAEIGPLSLRGDHSDLRGYLIADPESGGIEGSVEGYLTLGVLALVIPDTRSTGRVEIDLAVVGTLEDPVLEGFFEVTDGRIRFLGFPQPLENVEASVTLGGGEAEIERIRAILGGGELAGRGGVALDGAAIDSYLLEFEGANVRVAYPEDFRGVYEGVLEMYGDTESALLAGDVRLLRGIYSSEFDLTEMFGIGEREYSAEEELQLPIDLILDVDFHATDGVWLRNEMAELESGFELRVGGKFSRPEVTGRLRILEGGTLSFRDIEYTIRYGTLDFVDLDRINPYLNLQAITDVEQYEIQLKIEGTFDRIEYELTSSPSLSQQDIIALLTTGSTLQDLTEPGGGSDADFTGDLATGYFAGALTAPFERQLQKLFGLERVRISPMTNRGAADPTARITLGKEVADDLFLYYSYDLSVTERQFYQAEWRATRKFRVTAERDTTGGIGGDFLYFTRFWIDPPEAVENGIAEKAEAASPEQEAGSRVSDIVLLGVEGRQREKYLRELPLRPGSPYRRSEMFEGAETIRADQVRQGRLQARVAAEAFEQRDDGGVRVVYRIEPGPKVEVSFSGISRKDEKKLRSRLTDLWRESFFTEFLFQDSRSAIEEFYRDRGHYAVDVRYEELEVPDGRDRRRIRFHVDPGEVVRILEVEIRGNDAVPKDRIVRQMFTRPQALFTRRRFLPKTLDEDLAAIRNLYSDQGFLAAQVLDPEIRLTTDAASVSVALEIVEGNRFTIGEVVVPGDLEFGEDELRTASGLEPGEVYSRARLIESESALRAWLDTRGHPDARVTGSAERGESTAVVRFEITPGIAKWVGAVEIEGIRLTQEKIVRRELMLEPGDPISREKILRSQHRLYKLGIFRNVRIDYLPMSADDPTQHLLRIRVEEGPPLGMTVGAGYDSEGGVRGSFSFTHDNVGGYDRSLSLQGRASGIERRIQLIAEEPRLFTRRWPALVSLLREHREEESYTLDRNAGAVRVENEFSKYWTAFLRYSFQDVNLAQPESIPPDVVTARDDKLQDLKLGDLGYSLVRDTRDDPLLPTRGTYFSMTARYFSPLFLSDARFVKGLFQGSYVRSFSNGTSYAAAASLGVARPFGSTASVPLPERFFAGGDSTVRGFPRDRLGPMDEITFGEAPDIQSRMVPAGGEALLILNHEFRYPIWGGLKGVVFYDSGNVYLTIDELDSLRLRHVLGAGLRLETPVGPLRIEYGRKLDREEGESSGELFFAIGNAF